MRHLAAPDVVQRVLAAYGRRGAAWIRELPEQVDALMEEWSLVFVGEPFTGAHAGLVVPVRDSHGRELVLKVVPAATWANCEADALAYWAGRGAARLVAVNRNRGALLMERVTPGTTLASMCSSDDRAATAAAAAVITELRSVRSGMPATLPDVATWIGALQSASRGAGPRALQAASIRAASLADDLLTDANRTVLHGDLQHYNILGTEHGSWLAVDPKGLIGPPEAEPAALLRNPRAFVLSHPTPRQLLSDRVAVLEERLGDDRQRLLLWGHVLGVVAAAWAHEDNEGETEVGRWLTCADVLRQVAGETNRSRP